VDFEEQPVDACGYGGSGEERDELRLATTDAACRRGLLHGMRTVKDYRRKAAHDGERTVIDHQRVVAEAGAALGEKDAVVARGAHLFNRMRHVPWGDELTLLYVDGTAGFAGGYQEIGLPAEERGNLKHIDGLGGNFAVAWLVHVGEDGNAGIFGQAAEDARALDKTGTAKALDAGAIGLVVAGLEDEGDTEVGCDAPDCASHGADVGLGLNNAGTGNEEQPTLANVDRPNFKGVAHERNSTVPPDERRSLTAEGLLPPYGSSTTPTATAQARAKQWGRANRVAAG